MLLSNARRFIGLIGIGGACLLLVGCGFHPMFIEDEGGGRVLVAPIPEKEGMLLRSALEDAFGGRYEKGDNTYLLKTSSLSFDDTTVTDIHNVAIYTKSSVHASFDIVDTQNDQSVDHFSVSRLCGTPAGRSAYEGVSSLQYAKSKCVDGFAEDVRARVVFFFRSDAFKAYKRTHMMADSSVKDGVTVPSGAVLPGMSEKAVDNRSSDQGDASS